MSPSKTALTILVLGLTLSATAAASDKPSALQLCFEGLGPKTPLFSEVPRRNYRAVGNGLYVLDLDVLINGRVAPERITRSAANCLRAWLPARPVASVTVRFDRTDTNLLAQTRDAKINLKPDLWHEGPTFSLERGAFSQIKTLLPGSLEVKRLETAEWADGARKVADLEQVASGRYEVSYAPPPPDSVVCPVVVTADASGTIRADNKPKILEELLSQYRTEIAPEIAKGLKEQCKPNEVLLMLVRITDGRFRNPWQPKITRWERPVAATQYELVIDGEARPFTPGESVELAYGQRVELREAAAGQPMMLGSAAKPEQPAERPQ